MCATALAAEDQANAGPVYIGGTLGISHTRDLVDNTTKLLDSIGTPGGTVEGNQTTGTLGLYLGIDASEHLEARLGYVDLGEYTAKVNMPSVPFNGKITFDWYAYTLDLLIKAPLQVSQGANQTSLFLKLGAAATRNAWKFSGDFGNDSGTDKNPIFVPGVGIKIKTSSHWSAVFEANYYAKLASSESGYDFKMWTFTGGLFYHF
jgi:hypothetical protein